METLDPTTAAWLEAIRTVSSRKYGDARKLLPANQDVNVRGIGGITALHVAAQRESDKMLLRLLLDGADHTLKDDKGRTPLQIAQRVQHCDWTLVFHDELVRTLTKNLSRTPTQTEVFAAMKYNRLLRFRNEVYKRLSAIHCLFRDAARQGDLDAVRSMVERGDYSIDSLGGGIAFSAALASGQLRVCEYLMANGAHLYSPCHLHPRRYAPQSTLVTAVQVGDAAFVRQLVANGASVFEPAYDANTCALAEAVKLGSIEMIETLLVLGIRPVPGRNGVALPLPVKAALHFESSSAEDETPWWLLAIACWLRDRQLVEHLFSTHAILNNREYVASLGANALVLAVYNEDAPLVAELLARGVCVSEEIKPGLSAITIATKANSADIVQMLSFYRIDDPTVRQWRPWSRPEGKYIMLQYLINPLGLDQLLDNAERIPKISAFNEAFRQMCEYANVRAVSIYLAHGIRVNYSSWNEIPSPLLQAILGDNTHGIEVARLLLENGASPMMNGMNGKSPLAVIESKLEYISCTQQRKRLEAARQLLMEFGASNF